MPTTDSTRPYSGPYVHARPSSALTDRERQVLVLIGQGLTNQEIGEQLFLSINSIKTYIRSAYRKIGVLRRTQAVVWIMSEVRADHQPAE